VEEQQRQCAEKERLEWEAQCPYSEHIRATFLYILDDMLLSEAKEKAEEGVRRMAKEEAARKKKAEKETRRTKTGAKEAREKKAGCVRVCVCGCGCGCGWVWVGGWVGA